MLNNKHTVFQAHQKIKNLSRVKKKKKLSFMQEVAQWNVARHGVDTLGAGCPHCILITIFSWI